MQRRRMPGSCPVCDEPFRVAKLACDGCGSSLEGAFDLSPFCRLSADQQRFVEVFIASRGNIREVERVLGISYPTVRSRLDEVIEALGYRVQRPTETEGQRRRVLEALDRGEISAEEALKALKEGE